MAIIAGLPSHAQDPDYSQYYNTPTYYNPAYVGLYQGLKMRFNYRRQWTKVPAKFNSYNFSADIGERNLPGAGGLGIIVNSTRSATGYTRNNMFGILPSVRIPLAENMIIQTGFMAAFVQKRMDWDNLTFPDEFDPVQGNIYDSKFVPPNDERVTYPDFSFGAIFQFEGNNNLVGTLGGAIHHLTKPNESFIGKNSPLPRRYVAHFDLIFDLSQSQGFYRKKQGFKLNPGILFQHQAQMNDYVIGTNVYFSRVYLGAWYKNESLEYDVYSHFVILGGISIPINDDESRIKFTYSYDMVINAEHIFTGPSHEIAIIFEFDNMSLIGTPQIGGVSNFRRGAERLECSPF